MSRTVRPTTAAPAQHSASTPGDRRPGLRPTGLRSTGLVCAGSAALIAAAIAAVAIGGPAAAASGTRLPAAAGSSHAMSAPTTPTGLPTAIEDLATYVPQVSCDPVAKPGVLALGRLLTGTYPGTGYVVSHLCGQDTVASEHADGRALDWQVSTRVPAQKAQADLVLNWLLAADAAGRPFANARRLGVMYVIWDNRIWGSYNPMSGWRPYSTCAAHLETASDAICHRDRLHISLSWAGATAKTSFWSKKVAAPDFGPCRPRDLNWAPAYTTRNAVPCPTYPAVTPPAGASATAAALVKFSGATIEPGDSGPVVSALQRSLGVVADGDFGPFTADALVAFQRRHALPPSGTPDAATWRALLADALTANKPTESVPAPARPTAGPLTPYLGTVLQYDSRGPAVMALQRRLKISVSGWFGPVTRAAVVNFQVAVGLPATGVVSTATWKALGA